MNAAISRQRSASGHEDQSVRGFRPGRSLRSSIGTAFLGGRLEGWLTAQALQIRTGGPFAPEDACNVGRADGGSRSVGEVTGSRPFRGIDCAVVGLVVCVLVVLGTLLTAGSAMAASVLSPSPSSEDFGGVDMHFEQTMQESFSNNSGSPVTVDPAGVQILGDTSSFSLQVGQDFCTGKTIPTGGSCHVNVLFGPLAGPGPKLRARRSSSWTTQVVWACR
jgi:hypothetical protein